MKTFEDLQYGDKVRMMASPLNNFFGIGFTSSSDEQVEKEFIIERYWEDDEKVQTSYKVRLTCMDENYAYENFYVSDFHSMIDDGTITIC